MGTIEPHCGWNPYSCLTCPTLVLSLEPWADSCLPPFALLPPTPTFLSTWRAPCCTSLSFWRTLSTPQSQSIGLSRYIRASGNQLGANSSFLPQCFRGLFTSSDAADCSERPDHRERVPGFTQPWPGQCSFLRGHRGFQSPSSIRITRKARSNMNCWAQHQHF